MKVLVCDDDVGFGNRLAKYVEAFFEQRGILAQCSVCSSGEQVLARQDLHLMQVAFLDVDMAQMNGIALGRELKRINPNLVLVYISAYLEFATEGYTVSAFRYLLKRDVERMLPGCLEAMLAEHSSGDRTLSVTKNRSVQEIPLDQIYYLESELRRINVYGDIPHTPLCSYYGKLSELPQSLYQNGFLQIGRSHVVNMLYIRQLSSYRVELLNGIQLSVSRTGYPAIRRAYLEWKGQFSNG